jgi:hypothetical protein
MIANLKFLHESFGLVEKLREESAWTATGRQQQQQQNPYQRCIVNRATPLLSYLVNDLKPPVSVGKPASILIALVSFPEIFEESPADCHKVLSQLEPELFWRRDSSFTQHCLQFPRLPSVVSPVEFAIVMVALSSLPFFSPLPFRYILSPFLLPFLCSPPLFLSLSFSTASIFFVFSFITAPPSNFSLNSLSLFFLLLLVLPRRSHNANTSADTPRSTKKPQPRIQMKMSEQPLKKKKKPRKNEKKAAVAAAVFLRFLPLSRWCTAAE